MKLFALCKNCSSFITASALVVTRDRRMSAAIVEIEQTEVTTVITARLLLKTPVIIFNAAITAICRPRVRAIEGVEKEITPRSCEKISKV